MMNEDTLDFAKQSDVEKIIKSEYLKENIKFQLHKGKILFSDLLKIEEITLNACTLSGKMVKVYFEDIKLFPNLKIINILNCQITRENISFFGDIEEVVLEDCVIDSLDNLNSKKVSLVGCVVNCDFNFNKDIEEFCIINTNCNSFLFLKDKPNLKKLIIKNVKNFTMEKINFKMPIKYLSIEDADIDYNILKNFEDLKTVSIDKIGSDDVNECCRILKEMGYDVLFNDMYKA